MAIPISLTVPTAHEVSFITKFLAGTPNPGTINPNTSLPYTDLAWIRSIIISDIKARLELGNIALINAANPSTIDPNIIS